MELDHINAALINTCVNAPGCPSAAFFRGKATTPAVARHDHGEHKPTHSQVKDKGVHYGPSSHIRNP